MTATNRNLDDGDAVPAGTGVYGRHRSGTGVSTKRYSIAGLLRRQHRPRRGRGDRRLQESNVHSFQRPDSDGLELDPTRTSLNGPPRMVAFNKIAGERVRFNSNVSMKTPGFDINDVGFLRRADTRNMSNWMQWRNERPSSTSHWRFNLNQWGGWNFDSDMINLGFNVNAHACSPTSGRPAWARTQPPAVRRSGDARRPRRVPQHLSAACGRISNSDGRKAVRLNVPVSPGGQPWIREWEIGPTSAGGRCRSCRRAPGSASIRIAIGRNGSKRRRRALRVRPASISGPSRYGAAQLHRDAQPLAAAVRAAVRLGRRLFGLQGAGDGRSRDSRGTRLRLQRQPGLQLPLVPHHQRAPLGVQPGSTLFVVWQQGREDTLAHGRFHFGNEISPASSTRRRATSSS